MSVITDAAMLRKMQRALKQGGDLYELNDIINMMQSGHMQGHVVDDTWAVTKVCDWPKRRTVDIVIVVGDMEDTTAMENRIQNWAIGLGATRLTAIGRDGWWKVRTPGWTKA